MKVLYGYDAKHRTWSKTELDDGTIDLRMWKSTDDFWDEKKPAVVTQHSHKSLMNISSGNSHYQEPITYITWQPEPPPKPITGDFIEWYSSPYGVPVGEEPRPNPRDSPAFIRGD